ncbi:MAG: peptide chain release factor 2 [Rickettsiales bacterium]|nr:peptide chain release factor 2 [Rickettsiales bacterium]
MFDPLDMEKKIIHFNKLSEEKNFWENTKNAQKIFKEKSKIEKNLNDFKALENELVDLKELFQLFKNDSDLDVQEDIVSLIKKIKKKANNTKLNTLLSKEADSNNCFIEIHAGAGGTESQDWAEMLLRMYNRWIEEKKFKREIINFHSGDEAGIKSVTIRVTGENAYGLLKTESGIHRLVRISPFDSQKRRHTSFASIWIYPESNEDIEIKVGMKDLRIDTYRASGAGGQHVNKTDSAVRITHIPTKIVVQCQNQRSQHQNKATALKMLESRLYEIELRNLEKKNSKNVSEKKEIGWGNQIRSYIMQPYQLVKDNRTGQETSDVLGVLDGNLDDFILNNLSNKL